MIADARVGVLKTAANRMIARRDDATIVVQAADVLALIERLHKAEAVLQTIVAEKIALGNARIPASIFDDEPLRHVGAANRSQC